MMIAIIIIGVICALGLWAVAVALAKASACREMAYEDLKRRQEGGNGRMSYNPLLENFVILCNAVTQTEIPPCDEEAAKKGIYRRPLGVDYMGELEEEIIRNNEKANGKTPPLFAQLVINLLAFIGYTDVTKYQADPIIDENSLETHLLVSSNGFCDAEIFPQGFKGGRKFRR
jgi:hypothetical protein